MKIFCQQNLHKMTTCVHWLCSVSSYPPLSVGVRPKRVHRPTDMSSELRTVTTAARARPHLDFTMSILPAGRTEEEEDTQRTCEYASTHARTHARNRKRISSCWPVIKTKRRFQACDEILGSCDKTSYGISALLKNCLQILFVLNNFKIMSTKKGDLWMIDRKSVV